MPILTDQRSLSEHLLKYWPIFASVFAVMTAIGAHQVSIAMDVNENSNDITDLETDVKQIQEVQVDIHKLNVTNARLQSEVIHIKESQKRTEGQMSETIGLLKTLINDSNKSGAGFHNDPEPSIRPYSQPYYSRPQW